MRLRIELSTDHTLEEVASSSTWRASGYGRSGESAAQAASSELSDK